MNYDLSCPRAETESMCSPTPVLPSPTELLALATMACAVACARAESVGPSSSAPSSAPAGHLHSSGGIHSTGNGGTFPSTAAAGYAGGGGGTSSSMSAGVMRLLGGTAYSSGSSIILTGVSEGWATAAGLLDALVRLNPPLFLRADVATLLCALYEKSGVGSGGGGTAAPTPSAPAAVVAAGRKRVLQGVATQYGLAHLAAAAVTVFRLA